MRRRITLLIVAAIMALTLSLGGATAAFAAKTETFSRGTCTVKAGEGGGSGSFKDVHHGQCGSQGSDV